MTQKSTIGAACLAFLLSSTSHGFTLDYFLDVQMDGTWTLSASTDAPGGIAAVVVNLVNVTSGTSVAPRSEFMLMPSAAKNGFVEGNIFAGNQAFAGQRTISFSGSDDTLVYGVGYVPVPDSAFTSGMAGLEMVGSANDIPVPFYTGTWDTQSDVPQFDWKKPGSGAVFPVESTIGAAGAGIHFHPPAMSPPRPGDFDGDWDVDGADFVAWQTNFPSDSGALLLDGDADGDGDVDGADFVIWQTNFGTDGVLPWNGMDVDGDGDIDNADFVVWQTNFPTLPDGSGSPVPGDIDQDGDVDGEDYIIMITHFPIATGSVVPEPSAGLLMAAAMLFYISGRLLRRSG